MSRVLRNPTFDAHRDEDVLRAVSAANEVGNARISEEDQLITCLRAISTESEIRRLIFDLDLVEVFRAKRGKASEKTVNVNSGDLIGDLGRRIYDIRCRIVHSKSEGQGAGDHGLLPGTHDETLVEEEIAIVEHLAEQALVASAERFALP